MLKKLHALFKKLRNCGYEVFPVNPNTGEVEGVQCYPNVASVPGDLDGVMIATHPSVSALIVRQCKERGVTRVWFHRSFGEGGSSNLKPNIPYGPIFGGRTEGIRKGS